MNHLSENCSAKRLRIYIGESDRWQGKQLYAVILELLKSRGFAGATVLRGVAGFGASSNIHTASILSLSEDLPLIIEVVDTPENIDDILDVIFPIVSEGLITLEDVHVVKYTHRYLNPIPADRPVGEVMTKDVVYLEPDWPVQQAWQTMLEHNIKALPVIDKKTHEVIGIVTDEDLLERAGVNQRLAIANRMDSGLINEDLITLKETKLMVQDVMSKPAITIRQKEALGLAASRMIKSQLKRLPVVDENDRLVGVLSRLDILKQVASMPAEDINPFKLVENAQHVADIMSPVVPIVSHQTILPDIINAFTNSNSKKLIVVDGKEKVIGLISDSDVIHRVNLSDQRGILQALKNLGKPPVRKMTAAQLMSPGALTAAPHLTLVEAVQLMLSNHRKWLVIIDRDGHALGLVDRHILFRALTSFYENQTMQE